MVNILPAAREHAHGRTGQLVRHSRVTALAAAAILAPATLLLSSSCSASAQTTPRPARAPSPAVYRWGVVGNRGPISQLQLDTPTAVAGIPASAGPVQQIATSNSDGYALTSTGAVYGWGVNSYGELGDGHLTSYDTKAVRVGFPAGVKITSLPNPMPFDAGLAIDSRGQAFGWGLNGDGDLCNTGLIENLPEPVPLSDVTLATGARTHSLFDSRGRVYACGSGDAGELGNGTTATHVTPTPVIGLPEGEQVTALTSSWEGSGALLADGSYYDWGYNQVGQLGNHTTADSARPVKVGLPAPVTQVFQGGSGKKNGQTIAVLEGGSVYDWGANSDGQLGDGTTASSDVPVRLRLPGGVKFTTVSSGGFASYAIDSSGRLWDWGSNSEGQLGLGSSIALETRPTSVGTRLTQVSSTAQNVAGFIAPARGTGRA
jgi:alpha-tubulin suppressor-like RCC1 family protein